MNKVFRYAIYDLMRSRWTYVYFLFYLLLGFVLLFLNDNVSKAVITLMNVIVILVPLISTIFGIMYYYSSKEFTELLLALPVKRTTIFTGQYAGVAASLTASLVIGLAIPFVAYGLFQSSAVFTFGLLLVIGAFLTFIFSALSYLIGLYNENKIKGFGYAILLWLFMAVIYDGLFLMALLIFEDYPLDQFALISTIINPIDLARILILLRLDISALLGYTGAIFKQFFGTGTGYAVTFILLSLWSIIPILFIQCKAKKKDF